MIPATAATALRHGARADEASDGHVRDDAGRARGSRACPGHAGGRRRSWARCQKEHAPDAVEGVLRGARDAHAREQRADDADRQAEAAAFPRMQFLGSGKGIRNCRARTVEGLLLLQPRVALQHRAEDGGEQEERQEAREKAVVGDQRGESAGPVVAELLDDRRDGSDSRALRQRLIQLVQSVGDATCRLPQHVRDRGGVSRAVELGGCAGRGETTSLCNVYPM